MGDRWMWLALAMIAGMATAPASSQADSEANPSAPTVYYLHGRIVEDLGPRGVSPRFGAYDYPGILDTLRAAGLELVSEVRPKDTDASLYADKIVADVRRRIAAGTPPDDITIVGASKGAVIATLVSTRLKNPEVRYVLLAGCNDWLLREMKPRLTGEILSIYEASDEIGGTCKRIVDQSPGVTKFKEIRLETGLGHGVLYRPLCEWVDPAVTWAKR